jgi:hypothetical protein
MRQPDTVPVVDAVCVADLPIVSTTVEGEYDTVGLVVPSVGELLLHAANAREKIAATIALFMNLPRMLFPSLTGFSHTSE